MKSDTLSLKTIINELDFLKKTVIITWNIRKKNLKLFATELTKKMTWSSKMLKNTINHLKERKTQNLLNNQNNSSATKNPNIVNIKSVIIEHPKTSHKLSKTIWQVKKFPK